MAAELGLEGTVQQITVNVLNGGEDSFQTMPVEFDLQSMDGKTSAKTSAFTATRATGDMQPVDWKRQAVKWRHLQGINFPHLGPRPVIDMLIGIDYEELGCLAPYVIRAKVLLQEMWTSAVDWDNPLDQHQACKVKKGFTELSQLSDVQVSRCLQVNREVETRSLHTFKDASGETYGAATYVRYQYKDGSISTSLVAAKTRVAPLSATSIPRLELMGAVLGLRLALSVAKVLKIDKHQMALWCDSMNVLW